jgi:hypothetical protein
MRLAAFHSCLPGLLILQLGGIIKEGCIECAPVEAKNAQDLDLSSTMHSSADAAPVKLAAYFKPAKNVLNEATHSFSRSFSPNNMDMGWFSRFCESFGYFSYLHSNIEGKKALDWIFSAWELIELGEEALVGERCKFLEETVFGLARSENRSKTRAKVSLQKQGQSMEANTAKASELFSFPLIREAFALAAGQVGPEELVELFTDAVYYKLLMGNYEAFSRFPDWSLFPESLVNQVFAPGRTLIAHNWVRVNKATGFARSGTDSYDIWPLKLDHLIKTASSEVILKVISGSSYVAERLRS